MIFPFQKEQDFADPQTSCPDCGNPIGADIHGQCTSEFQDVYRKFLTAEERERHARTVFHFAMLDIYGPFVN